MRKILLLLSLFLTLSLSGQVYPGVVASQGGSGTVTFCTEYQAIYDVMTTPPSYDTAVYQNTMVKALVDGGYWTNRIDLFYVLATRLEADAKRNWGIVGSYDLTDPGATTPVFTKYEGFTGSSVGSDYLSTGYIPATHAVNIAQNSTTICVYLRNDLNETTTVFGMEDGGNYLKIRPSVSNAQSTHLNAGTAQSFALTGSNSAAFHIATRRGATETEGYQNGASIGTDTDASIALPTTDWMAVLANNDDGTIEEFANWQVSVIILMNAVSDADAAAINTIIEAYMDAIGKGVQ